MDWSSEAEWKMLEEEHLDLNDIKDDNARKFIIGLFHQIRILRSKLNK